MNRATGKRTYDQKSNKLPPGCFILDNVGEPRPLVVAEKDVSKVIVGVTPGHMANLHRRGEGPRAFLLGNRRYYLVHELVEFFAPGAYAEIIRAGLPWKLC